jgi:hypothetical protein
MDNKTAFLAGAILDAQSTIRAIDVKVGALLVGLLAPFSNIGRICAHFEYLVSLSKPLGLVLLAAFFSAWVAALVALVRAIAAIDNPANHITNHAQHKGAFYGGGLYKFGLLDTFLNRELIKASKDVASFEKDIPENKKDIEIELAFEQMKLIYIRDIKLHRLKSAINFSSIWFCAGVLSYIISKLI